MKRTGKDGFVKDLLCVAVSVAAVLGLAGSSRGETTYRVPQDYPTIQEAIDTLPNTGGTVLVSPGVYSPDTNGERYPLRVVKAVALRAEEGAELSAGDLPPGDDPAMIVCDHTGGTEISGFVFSRRMGSTGMCTAIWLEHCSGITNKNNRFDGMEQAIDVSLFYNGDGRGHRQHRHG